MSRDPRFSEQCIRESDEVILKIADRVRRVSYNPNYYLGLQRLNVPGCQVLIEGEHTVSSVAFEIPLATKSERWERTRQKQLDEFMRTKDSMPSSRIGRLEILEKTLHTEGDPITLEIINFNTQHIPEFLVNQKIAEPVQLLSDRLSEKSLMPIYQFSDHNLSYSKALPNRQTGKREDGMAVAPITVLRVNWKRLDEYLNQAVSGGFIDLTQESEELRETTARKAMRNAKIIVNQEAKTIQFLDRLGNDVTGNSTFRSYTSKGNEHKQLKYLRHLHTHRNNPNMLSYAAAANNIYGSDRDPEKDTAQIAQLNKDLLGRIDKKKITGTEIKRQFISIQPVISVSCDIEIILPK